MMVNKSSLTDRKPHCSKCFHPLKELPFKKSSNKHPTSFNQSVCQGPLVRGIGGAAGPAPLSAVALSIE